MVWPFPKPRGASEKAAPYAIVRTTPPSTRKESTCCPRSLLRADIDDQVCDFFGCREALDERCRARRFEELLLGFLLRNALRVRGERR